MTKPATNESPRDKAVALIEDTVYSVSQIFADVRVAPDINFEREAGFAIQQLVRNDYTMNIARANPQSVRNAVTNIAAIGISLNPARKQAYLVPRDNAICLDISYMGLLDIAVESGSILWGQAEIVYAKDTFKRRGYDAAPLHEFDDFSKDRGDIVGAYVVVKTKNGDYLTTSMPIDKIYAIRDRSPSYKNYLKDNSKKTPWITDPDEMIKKVVIKRAYKTWPKSDRLAEAIHHLNTEAGEGIPMADEPVVFDPQRLVELVATIAACVDPEAVAKAYAAAVHEMQSAAIDGKYDKAAYQSLRATAEKRIEELKKPAADANTIDGEARVVDDNGFEEDFQRKMARENGESDE